MYIKTARFWMEKSTDGQLFFCDTEAAYLQLWPVFV
jgi:hypothetical protein